MFNKARWIWTAENSKPNDWVIFQKSFYVKEKGSYTLKISADTRYFLTINQEIVVLDGGLFRDAYCERSGFADSVELSKFLKIGENQMEILVWHYGNGGRNNNPLEVGGLIFECQELNLFSDKTTLCARHPSYGDTQAPYPIYLYGGYNIGYDANKFLQSSDFKPSTEQDSKLYGTLFDRPIPLFRFSEIIKGDYNKEGDIYSVKLPLALHVLPYFKLQAEGGEIIDIRTDRYTVNGGPGDHYGRYNGHRTEYICKNGLNEYLNLDWFACEEILFTIPDSVKILELGYRKSEYDTDLTGILQTDNQMLNTLLQKCARTLKFCMRDNFMDCPDRERGQWIGDVSVQTPQVFFALDHKAIPLLKKAIMNFILLRKGDVLVGNVPGINFSELPPQSLNAISEHGMIAEYYYFTGDREILELCYQPCLNYLKLWDMGEDGLINKREGNWYWFDHLYNIDHKVLENCWYYSALKFAKYMALQLEKDFDSGLNNRLQSIEENFDKAFWKGTYYASSAFTDDRANAMAVLTGLAHSDKYNHIKDVLVSVFNCTAYMEGYVCEALCKMGYKDYAFKRMMSRYYNLIQNENSTLWEDFYILGTKNHAWTGAPLTLIYKYFLGLKSEDHLKTITINPDFSILKSYEFCMDIEGKTLRVKLSSQNGKTISTIDNHTKSTINIVE